MTVILTPNSRMITLFVDVDTEINFINHALHFINGIDSCTDLFEIEMVMFVLAVRHLSSDNGMATLLPPSNNDA